MTAPPCAQIVLDALKTAVDPLATFDDSPQVRVLRRMAADFEEEVKKWTPEGPEEDEREIMMQRVLALNVAVAKLVRGKSSLPPP
jgi:hypothetical protein